MKPKPKYNHSDLVHFIKDLYGRKKIIALHEPYLKGNEKKYISKTIESSYVSTVGEYVNKFESKIANFVGSKYAIATSSGTSALHVSLILNNCSPNTEVITQAISFVATCNAINYCGAKPIFIDVDLDTMSMSPTSLRQFLENCAEVRDDGRCWNKITNNIISVCLPMHTYGYLNRIDEISKICKKYKLAVIEDAAESLGSFIGKKHSGTYGKMSSISFNGNKIITTGGGGAIITNNNLLAKKAKHISTTAKISHKWNFIHDEVGFNYRMPNINAALGLAQLEQLDILLKKKKKLFRQYKNFFNKTHYSFFEGSSETSPNYWLNILLAKDKSDRDEILKILHLNNILARPVWEPLNKLSMYKNSFAYNLINTQKLADRIVCLPSSAI
tara:strand:+ start:14 stop:1174 length:1161 start_codon:yes stop_codon:yes gene_type:complete